ncbi:tryptophan-rich sensory protein, partial [Pseudonocardia sp. SID8383]|nr:tryptophan-rich sensory protein [Pseudonocardia sp. SID8383]
PYAATAAWALVWIAVESATTGTVPVTVVAAIGVVAVVVAAALRAREGLRAAFG